MTNDYRKSDRLVVPEKPSNRPDIAGTEKVEERCLPKENKRQQNMLRTRCREGVLSKLQLIHQKAKTDKKVKFTALMHHIYNVNTLRWAYLEIKRNAAPGVDRETWRSYGDDLENKLQDLSDRLRRGAYRAKPVRRVYIPKADGKQRPLGVTNEITWLKMLILCSVSEFPF